MHVDSMVSTIILLAPHLLKLFQEKGGVSR